MYSPMDDGTIAGRKAVMGALRLYLDFINLFPCCCGCSATAVDQARRKVRSRAVIRSVKARSTSAA
jgi:hypothetical protein